MSPDGPDLSPAKAELLARWREGGAVPGDGQAIPTRPGQGPVPLSLAQQRVWFVEQLQPGTAAYNLFFCARLDGHLEPEPLAQALADLVGRHQALRTTIGSERGEPFQVVDGGAAPALDVVDLRPRSGDDGLAAAVERVGAAIHQPFDLAAGPLARVLLCRLRDRDVLGLAVHHLVADGWSLGVALRELSAAYQARAAGQEPALPPLPIQYSDFALWQRDQARAADWESDLGWWRERLLDLPAVDLPADRPRPPVFTARGDWRELRLDAELSEALRRLARAEDATQFMVVLAALAALLHKLTGLRDLAVGANVAGRVRPETFGLIGNFANVLVLRTHLDGDPTFRELLGRVRVACLGAFAHQQLPFEKLVEELVPERDLSRTPLAQVLFVLQPPLTEWRFAGLDMELVEIGTRTARADLELHLWDLPALTGRFQFRTDLFDAATVERLVTRFQALSAGAVADPDRKLSSWSLLLPPEREQVRTWGHGPPRRLPEAPVHELIAVQAQRTPSATAVVDHARRLTYEVLEQRASQLANHLRAQGAGPETPVAICVERSAAMVEAVLGVLKTGGPYVPLDPRYPPERLAFIVRDAGARVVVTEEALAARLTVAGARLVCLDSDAAAIATQPVTSPRVPVDPDNLAYAVYTSGSTGTPKGVQMPHRALANFALYELERPGLGPGTVSAAIFSLAFDASVAEIFPPLLAGGTVVVATYDDTVDGGRLAALVARHGVNLLLATPTTWRMVLAAGGVGERRLIALCGAEATTADIYDALASGHDSAWNLYGPTETTVWATADRMRRNAPVSLGQPGANTTVHLVDEDFQEVPVGVFGELCIGGAGLARGYLGRPGMTAERFVANPFADWRGQRLYRTGDLARWRPDGSIEFGGRRDHQVKLRGHRIELGEVEAGLCAHPAVRQAVAALRPSDAGEPRLVAWVVARAGAAPTGPQLARFLRDTLPEYMVPSAFVFLDKLSKTASDKVDRLRLPPPERERPALDVAYLAPRTPLEEEVATIAARYLGLDQVGVHDDFFELGGHSLLAAKLVAELRERYQVELVLQKLFLLPTIEHLASQIEEELSRKEQLGSEAARLRRVVERLPDQTVDALLSGLLADDGPEPM
jgi:amino acid adenylation domain-containing protein